MFIACLRDTAMFKIRLLLIPFLLLFVQATAKNHAYPDSPTEYEFRDNNLIIKINLNDYRSIYESISSAKLLFKVMIYANLALVKSNECAYIGESSQIYCPINEFNSDHLSFVVQTVLSRTETITGLEKKDVIDQSPIINSLELSLSMSAE